MPSSTFNHERSTKSALPEPSHNLTSRRGNTEMLAWILIPICGGYCQWQQWIARPGYWGWGGSRGGRGQWGGRGRGRGGGQWGGKWGRWAGIKRWHGAQCNCGCIRTSKRHPIVGITMMCRLFIIFHWLREWTSQFTEVGYGLGEWTVRSRKVGLRELTRYSAEEPPPWMD